MKQLRGTALRHAALLGAAVGLAAILGDSRAIAQTQDPASPAPGISQNRAGDDGTQLGGLPRTGAAARPSRRPWLSPLTLIVLPLVLARLLHRRYQTRRYGNPLARTPYDYGVALFTILIVYWLVVRGVDWTTVALGLSLGAVLTLPTALATRRRLDRVIDLPQRQMAAQSNWIGLVVVLAAFLYLEAQAMRYLADYVPGIGLGMGLNALATCVLARTHIARLERDAGGPIVVVKRTGDGA